MAQRLYVLIYVNHTIRSDFPSGIQRVVSKVAEYLPEYAEVSFVTWDYSDGQLRHVDARGLAKLYQGRPPPAGVKPDPCAHRVNYRFADTLPSGRACWLLMPETSYHGEHGTEVMTRILSMCREYGVRTAALFYDLIPLAHPSYRDLAPRHACYVMQLARCDRLYAISHHSGRTLLQHYQRALGKADPDLADLASRIVALPLGESNQPAAPTVKMSAAAERDGILLIGTVEPRKRQLQVLEAVRSLPQSISRRFSVHVVGSVHPSIEARFKRLISASSQFHYQGYLPDADARALFSRTRFSVFASDDEGFGLPIAESLAHGVPCLTANFGAMAESAHGGGCLTVDVTDQRALSAGLLRLMRDDALVSRLRAEIAERRFRTWREYAESLVGDMQATSNTEAELLDQMSDTVVAAIQEGLGNAPRPSGSYALVEMEDGRFKLDIDAGQAPRQDLRQGESSGACAFGVTAIDARSLTAPDDLLARAARSSVCVLEGRGMLGAFVQRVQEQSCPQMLPDILCAETDEGGLPAVGRSISQRLTERKRRIEIASRERLLCRLARSGPASRDPSLPLLSIVVSTYNRASFVEENVRWLLHVLRQFPRDVHLTVVDNASTDDTADRLAKFALNPRLTLIANPVNLGMLGNLRACASLIAARHVWITGDDDFIVPSGLAEIYAALKAHPDVPFAFVNFGVYRRSALAQGDTAKRLIAERVPLSARAARSGIYPIKYIAEQHDNLFTAFYPIIFRSDLLAACFNYPFDGKPFVDLVESVPTTKILLETYADTDAYWCAQIGTVGNVANSWSRHLPRWHAVLMPRILQLARDVGVDPTKLGEWSNLHFDLFREAKKVAEREGEALDIQPHELDVASRVFRRPLALG